MKKTFAHAEVGVLALIENLVRPQDSEQKYNLIGLRTLEDALLFDPLTRSFTRIRQTISRWFT